MTHKYISSQYKCSPDMVLFHLRKIIDEIKKKTLVSTYLADSLNTQFANVKEIVEENKELKELLKDIMKTIPATIDGADWEEKYYLCIGCGALKGIQGKNIQQQPCKEGCIIRRLKQKFADREL